jgi:hypothetical protein
VVAEAGTGLSLCAVVAAGTAETSKRRRTPTVVAAAENRLNM